MTYYVLPEAWSAARCRQYSPWSELCLILRLGCWIFGLILIHVHCVIRQIAPNMTAEIAYLPCCCWAFAFAFTYMICELLIGSLEKSAKLDSRTLASSMNIGWMLDWIGFQAGPNLLTCHGWIRNCACWQCVHRHFPQSERTYICTRTTTSRWPQWKNEALHVTL